MTIDHPFFSIYSKSIVRVFTFFLCILSSIAIAFSPLKKSLLLLSFIFGLSLVFICIVNYNIGYIISMGAGFSIFTLSRLFKDSFPIGWIVELFIYSSFLGLIIDCILKRKSLFSPLYHPVTFSFVFYLLFLVWQFFNPEMNSVFGWLSFFRRQFMILILFILTVHAISGIRDIKRVFGVWFIFTFLAALYAILTQFFGLPAFENNWVLSSKTRESLFYLVDGFRRKYSFYSDPAAFGMDMAATSLILGLFLILSSGTTKRIILFTLSIICLFGAIFSGTRTAYLMIFAGFFLFFLFRGLNKKTFLLGIIFVSGLIAVVQVPIYNNLFLNRIRTVFQFNQDASLQVRNINRERIQPFIHANPIGGGIYTSGGQGMEYDPSHYLAGFPPDSGYLRAALETGWTGLVFLLLFHFVILRSGIYAFFKSTNKLIKSATLVSTAALFSFVIANYGQEPFGQIPSCFLFCICIGTIVRSDQLSNNSIT